VRRIPLQVLGLILFVTAAKVALTLVTEPAGVEAYLWLSAKRPALGYYDFPGMQAWVGGLSTAILGDTALGLRAGMIGCGALTIWLAFLAARRLYDEKVGRLAAMSVALAPVFFTGSLEAKPDAPLLLFWIATVWAIAHALAGDSPRWWYLGGLFLGLAMESKYHSVFLGFGVPAFLAFSPDHRSWLKRKEPWLAVGVALIAFSPTILWNAQHHWQSFLYQSVGRAEEGAFQADQIYKFPVRQLRLVTPVLCLWAWAAGGLTFARWKQADWRDRYLAAIGLPIIVFFLFMIFTTPVKGYWPGPGYLTLLILSSTIALRGGVWGQRLHFASYGVLAALYLLAPIVLVIGIPEAQRRSWARLAEMVSQPPADFIMSDEYHVAAQLAFHRRSLDVWDLTPAGRSVKSFPNWWSPEKYRGKNAIVVYQTNPPDPGDLELVRRSFEQVDPPLGVTVRRSRLLAKDKEKYFIQYARSYKGGVTVERKVVPDDD
jgi:4-amino-4-deoxy-L-arabinose transferase-like glycosyltransferase